MNLTKEQVTAGIAAGLALTDPDGDVQVPMKFCAGTLVLRELLLMLGSGQLALVPTVQPQTPPAAGADPKAPPHRTPAQKKTARKTSKKKTKKQSKKK